LAWVVELRSCERLGRREFGGRIVVQSGNVSVTQKSYFLMSLPES
jgi:hypothetical protein